MRETAQVKNRERRKLLLDRSLRPLTPTPAAGATLGATPARARGARRECRGQAGADRGSERGPRPVLAARGAVATAELGELAALRRGPRGEGRHPRPGKVGRRGAREPASCVVGGTVSRVSTVAAPLHALWKRPRKRPPDAHPAPTYEGRAWGAAQAVSRIQAMT